MDWEWDWGTKLMEWEDSTWRIVYQSEEEDDLMRITLTLIWGIDIAASSKEGGSGVRE